MPPRDAVTVAVTPAVSAEIPCVDVVKLETIVVPLSKPALDALNTTDGYAPRTVKLTFVLTNTALLPDTEAVTTNMDCVCALASK